jgi:hypothetical protein
MIRPIPRKTVYAATLITILALAGGWTLAAGTTTTQGPAQTSNITVTTPTGFVIATVQSTQLMTVSPALISGLNGPAGTQAGPGGNGLNSSSLTNAPLTPCAAAFCELNFSAVDMSSALLAGDTALQVMLTVTQPADSGLATGFDVQVEILYTVGATALSAFGTGYFDSSTTTTANPAFYAVALYVDLGTSALNLPSVGHIVVTMNGCITATTCP